VKNLSFIDLTLFALLLLPLKSLSHDSDSFDKNRLLRALNLLQQNKENILTNSLFGQNEVLYYNPLTGHNFTVISDSGRLPLIARQMTPEELEHAKKVLDVNSLYSQESFSKQMLVINLCVSCVRSKFSEFTSDQRLLDLISEEWLAALTFHEYMHAFDQKGWGEIYSKYVNCPIRVQEGSAFLAEAKAFSLLKDGTSSSVSSYIKLFESSLDPESRASYTDPAKILYQFEARTGENFMEGLISGSLELCSHERVDKVVCASPVKSVNTLPSSLKNM